MMERMQNVEENPFPRITLVGRPNVGKSSLFNVLSEKRIAIVHHQKGTTRDRISSFCDFSGIQAQVVDTGGIFESLPENIFQEVVEIETKNAIQDSDLILFLVDGRENITPIDQEIASYLRKKSKSVILVVNKIDNSQSLEEHHQFYSLGMKDIFPISVSHRKGIEKLKKEIFLFLNPRFKKGALSPQDEERIKVAIVGKPNTGKSSLINKILGKQQLIVSDIAGTTSDSVDSLYEDAEIKYTFIDTAGMKRKTKYQNAVEFFSANRTYQSIDRADICLLVLDSLDSISAMDRRIARRIEKAQKPCIILFNKFDLFHPDGSRKNRMEEAKEYILQELFFLHYVPIICTSSKKGNLREIFSQIRSIVISSQNLPNTGKLNRFLTECQKRNPPSKHKIHKKVAKLFYLTLSIPHSIIPSPTFILFTNQKKFLQKSYIHYLSNSLRKEFTLKGIPISLDIRSKKKNESS